MTIWDDFSIEARVREILDVPSHVPGHHFGRPFLTAYQIAISFAERFPSDHGLIGKQIGGKDAGPSQSLAQYLAKELSAGIKNRRLPGIEGADLHGTHLKKLEYRSSEGNLEASTGSSSELSMFRVCDD
ncbi:MAG: hypothetical protein OYH76_24700 [Defluviicoccus sp.]|nr:hypothetical protein [Defluviicoccus sp.]MDE0279108.1 hypothetical protein [Defluviicoccus sp.]